MLVYVSLLIYKAEKPKGYMTILRRLSAILGIEGVRGRAHTVMRVSRTNAELAFAIHNIASIFATLTDGMVFPKRINKVCFHYLLTLIRMG